MNNKINFNKSNFYAMQSEISLIYGGLVTEAMIIELIKDLLHRIKDMDYRDLKAKENALEFLNKVIEVIETDSEEEVDRETIKIFLDIIEKLHSYNSKNENENKVFKIGIELMKKKIDNCEY